jgi:tripartite-type tricarboxylate transporter receptor subunit TctC
MVTALHAYLPNFVLAVVLAALACSAPAQAQNFPAKPVRLVVPTGPGGGYDFIGRHLAEKLSEELGQQFIVENRAGAAGQIGTQVVAASAPDGYTLLVGGLGNITWVPALFRNVPYDAPNDFVPVAIVAAFSYALIARSSLPQASLQDVLAFARANPGKLSIANPGPGTGQHVAAALLKHFANVDVLHVSYKSAQQAYPDLLSGRVDLFFDNTSTVRPHVEGGRVKALAVSSSERSPLLPQVPAAREAGLPGVELESWIGLFAPAKTPRPVIERVRTATAKTMQTADMLSRLQAGGWRSISMSGSETEAFVRAEAAKWPPLLRQAGVAAE